MTKLWAIIIFLPLVFSSPAEQSISRVMFIGNSITHLYAYDAWPGGWGVAASQPDKDYVHRVQLGLTAEQGHIVEIETARADVNFTELFSNARTTTAEFLPDVVVIQVGDNAFLDEATYKRNLHALVDGICECTIIVTGVYYDGESYTIPTHRSSWNAQVAAEVGATFVPISDLYNGWGCAPGDYVCTHPDDATMQEIATRIIQVIW